MKTNRSKKKLKLLKTVVELGSTFPESKLDKLIQWFQEKKTEWENQGFTDLELQYESNWDSPYDLHIVGVREETDKEYNTRMEAIAKEKRSEAVKLQEHIKFIETEAKKLGILQ